MINHLRAKVVVVLDVMKFQVQLLRLWKRSSLSSLRAVGSTSLPNPFFYSSHVKTANSLMPPTRYTSVDKVVSAQRLELNSFQPCRAAPVDSSCFN